MTFKPISIYVLRLEGGRYYVGQAVNPSARERQHRRGNGARWTEKYKVEEVAYVFETYTWRSEEALRIENAVTLLVVEAYGMDAVQGGAYCFGGENRNYSDREKRKRLSRCRRSAAQLTKAITSLSLHSREGSQGVQEAGTRSNQLSSGYTAEDAAALKSAPE